MELGFQIWRGKIQGGGSLLCDLLRQCSLWMSLQQQQQDDDGGIVEVHWCKDLPGLAGCLLPGHKAAVGFTGTNLTGGPLA